uniref:Uncharacterized protein n=1 Tax=Pararge aegeria TaxID=116150 RepID=S4PMG1_9NEOP
MNKWWCSLGVLVYCVKEQNAKKLYIYSIVFSHYLHFDKPVYFLRPVDCLSFSFSLSPVNTLRQYIRNALLQNTKRHAC